MYVPERVLCAAADYQKLRLSSEITCAAEFRGLESTMKLSTIYTIASGTASMTGFFAGAVFCTAILLMPRWIA